MRRSSSASNKNEWRPHSPKYGCCFRDRRGVLRIINLFLFHWAMRRLFRQKLNQYQVDSFALRILASAERIRRSWEVMRPSLAGKFVADLAPRSRQDRPIKRQTLQAAIGTSSAQLCRAAGRKKTGDALSPKVQEDQERRLSGLRDLVEQLHENVVIDPSWNDASTPKHPRRPIKLVPIENSVKWKSNLSVV